jgi:protein TonB
MKRSKDKDDFLKKPHYLGGDTAMKEFVAKNIRYPEEARAAKIEGKVIVAYDVNDNGKVSNVHVIKGLGYGCDEEAMRVIRMFPFGKVRNRKMRLKVTKKTSINFKLPKTSINYTLTPEKKPAETKAKTDPPKKESGYSYTIEIK